MGYSAPGPFFTEKSLSSTYLMGISFKSKAWQPWMFPQLINSDEYFENLSYQRLKRAEFEKLLGWYAYSKSEEPSYRDYLLDYLVDQYAPKHADSLAVMVLWRVSDNWNIKNDTLDVRYYAITP